MVLHSIVNDLQSPEFSQSKYNVLVSEYYIIFTVIEQIVNSLYVGKKRITTKLGAYNCNWKSLKTMWQMEKLLETAPFATMFLKEICFLSLRAKTPPTK